MLNLPRERGREFCLTYMWLLLKLSGTLRQFVCQEMLGEWLGANCREMLMECAD